MKKINISYACDICGKHRAGGSHGKCSKIRQAQLKKQNTRDVEFVSKDGRINHIVTESPQKKKARGDEYERFASFIG